MWTSILYSAERFNQTLEEMIRKSITDDKAWDEVLEEVLFGYRTAQHSSTGYSPFYLMYNR
jgi:hypothetical protein